MDRVLDGYDWSKGTLRYPIDQPLRPELVARLVEGKLSHLAGAGLGGPSITLIRRSRKPPTGSVAALRSGHSDTRPSGRIEQVALTTPRGAPPTVRRRRGAREEGDPGSRTEE